MKIDNTTDTITFDIADIALLSPGMQKALQSYLGTNLDDFGNLKVLPAQALSDAVNHILTDAKKVAARAQVDNLAPLTAALALADDATKAKIQPYLDQAAAAAGVVIKPQPAPLPVVQASPAPLKNTTTTPVTKV